MLKSVYDCSVIELPRIENAKGNITPVHSGINLPFEIARIFYLYDIPGGEARGAHAHRECHQFLVAASGSFEVVLDDGYNKRTVTLNRPYFGLHIPPGIWAAEQGFSSGSICLVLTSHIYDEADYIRDYASFINYTAMKPSKLGLYFDEFVVGETVEHALSKTVFESDNNFFSLLTMNHHPVHTNLDYARKNQHGQLLVVGTLVFSLVVGMTVPDISGKAIANLGYEDIKHLRPVFINDTLYAKTIVLDKRETVGYNQHDEAVISFRRHVLVKKQA